MKKALLICAVVITLLAAVSGTIAYFTDTVEGYGQAASGELSILQHEYDVYDAANPAACTPYTQGQMIYPGVSVNKVVTVENIGKNVAYVRTFIAVPTAGEGKSLAELSVNEAENNGWVWSDAPIPGQSIDGVLYDIYVATYTTPLNPGKTTTPSLMGYTVSPKVSQDGTEYVWRDGSTLIPLGTSESFNILVATEASQAIVFENANEAMLETFGKDHHPWQTVVFAATQDELDTAIANAASDYNTRIGLYKGTYTLPETLPNGIRIFAMDTDVEITNATLSGYDIEIDGVVFPNALFFTGHGSFQEVTFIAGYTTNPTTGEILFDHCIDKTAPETTENQP
ncbi:MAG: hypothetical protein IJN44_08355 [Clostridia bacterium]|nr:hypothetical protein [Clostridia bacterium]